VLTGYNDSAQLRRSQPDLIVEHLGELQALLDRSELRFFEKEGDFNRLDPSGPVATVGALIFDDTDRVLMIRTHKWSNLWGIPGGKIKSGESTERAVAREIKEETNLVVTDVRFVLVQDCIHSREFYKDAHFILLNYTCRSGADREVVLNEEAQEFRWVPIEEAFQLPLNQPTLRLLRKVQESMEENGG
jgi:ADP-ribose pyrophosphatase YjhB (NUDIX family)